MATAEQTGLGTDVWMQIPASWEAYERLLASRGDKRRPKYIFCDGRLTIVSPGHPHDSLTGRLSGLIHEALTGLSIPCHSCTEVTLLESASGKQGTEGDLTYYLTNIKRVAGKRKLVMGVDPPPDLVIETVVSHPEDDALEAYRRYGVREVWVCKPSGLTFLTFDDETRVYRSSPVSTVIPHLAPGELETWLFHDETDDTLVWKMFRVWVEQTLVPRQQPRHEG